MKEDLDRLMEERELDALIVAGNSSGNPVMQYVTGGIHLENALVLKPRGGETVLIHGSMERDNASRTGYRLVDRDQTYNPYQLVRKHGGDEVAARCDGLIQVMSDFDLSGRLAFYGQADMGSSYRLLTALNAQLEHVEICGEYGYSLFDAARETKDAAELEDMTEIGRRSCLIVDEVKEFLQGHGVRDEVLIQQDGTPLTIGDVRAFLRPRLLARGLKEDHATIFAQGEEAAVPHNAGSDDRSLCLGKPIIFDFFPRGESNYFHDMTRTWCLGYAPDEVTQAWEETKELFDQVMAAFKPGVPCRDLQELACDFYESRNRQTLRSSPGTHSGYVHSLGHGIGLDIHEGPNLSSRAGNDAVLQPGHVITVEPGLYYPEKEFGVRIEDAVALDEQGDLKYLTRYPYDLVVPMPKA